jgi:hypothetical protein
MPTAWRQGDLIAPDDAIVLGLIEHVQRDTHRVVVISHSCDIASAEDVEPEVELLIGCVVAEIDANFRNGHSIRKLNLGAERAAGTEWALYCIADRRVVAKLELLRHPPWPDGRYPQEQLKVLRRWLAQRYSRSEFPDAFIEWLKASGVGSRFEDLGKRYSANLVSIYFDLDDDSERNDPDNPYALGISLVYGAGDAANEGAADEARGKLDDLFRRLCLFNGRWRWIELTYCEAVADGVFPLRAANQYRRWRFEHRSLGGEPISTD